MLHGHLLSASETELLVGIMGKDIAQGVFLNSKAKEKNLATPKQKQQVTYNTKKTN